MNSFFTTVFLAFLSASAQARTTISRDESSKIILNATAAYQGQFPYQLEIFRNDPVHLCSAALVQVSGIQVALTTAHCLEPGYPEIYTIVGGELDLKQTSGLEQSRQVSRIVRHPNFTFGLFFNDIALVFLNESFQLNDNVKPISLPGKFEEVATGTNVTFSGFGGEMGFLSPNLLQYGSISVISLAQCNATWSEDATGNWVRIEEGQFCVEAGWMMPDVCYGDNGGPATSQSDNGVLFGIMSLNIGCYPAYVNPAVFTEVSYYVDWIEKTVEKYKNSK